MTAHSPRENLHHTVLIKYQISLVKMSSREGIRMPPPMGPSYLNAMPRHMAELRNEAIRRYNSIKVEKMPLSYSGFFSKSVFKVTQDPDQIKRALEGTGGPTEIRIEPDGELITIQIDNYLTIHVEPVTLPHRSTVSPYNNTLVTEPTKVTSPEASAAATNSQREVAPRARQPTAKKKKATANDLAYVPARLSLIHISEPTRHAQISYAVFCLKKKK